MELRIFPMAASVKVFWLRTGVKLCENLLRKH